MKNLFICVFMLSSVTIFAAEKETKVVKVVINKVDSCTVTKGRVNADGTVCAASATASTCAEADKIAESRLCC